MPYRFIDLFAGLGGFHLALEALGHECVFASELKEDLQTLYKQNFPKTPIYGDITLIDPKDIPSHDIICAGFPCQPFSQAGKREGFNDSKQRGTLFDYICAIVAEHKPKYIFLENVQNLKNHDNGNTWKVIQEKLAALNYDVKADILSPHQFGLPQHRKRIFIVAVNSISQFVKADSLHHTECMEQQRHKFYACQIHTLSKMLLHNREDLVNFDRVLEISSFHEKKRPNFSFKLLNFRDFYKFNHLKTRCLTA